MSKQEKTKHSTRFFNFVERNNKTILAIEAVLVVGYFVAPTVRKEIADYHLMQVKIDETLRLVEAIAFDEEPVNIKEVNA